MAVQIVNTYAFCVKRISALFPGGASSPPPTNPALIGGSYNGAAAYEGEQVYVAASSLANAQAVLVAQYAADLGPVTGGAIKTPGVLTTMTGS